MDYIDILQGVYHAVMYQLTMKDLVPDVVGLPPRPNPFSVILRVSYVQWRRDVQYVTHRPKGYMTP